MTKPYKFPRLIATQPATPIPELPFPKISATISASRLHLSERNPRTYSSLRIAQLYEPIRRIGVDSEQEHGLALEHDIKEDE
jgi:hypothetical protein